MLDRNFKLRREGGRRGRSDFLSLLSNRNNYNCMEEEKRAIFVGNFEYDASSNDIRDLFKPFGDVQRLDMKKGFAFVFMQQSDDGQRAIQALHGTPFGQRPRTLKVEWARGDGTLLATLCFFFFLCFATRYGACFLVNMLHCIFIIVVSVARAATAMVVLCTVPRTMNTNCPFIWRTERQYLVFNGIHTHAYMCMLVLPVRFVPF